MHLERYLIFLEEIPVYETLGMGEDETVEAGVIEVAVVADRSMAEHAVLHLLPLVVLEYRQMAGRAGSGFFSHHAPPLPKTGKFLNRTITKTTLNGSNNRIFMRLGSPNVQNGTVRIVR